MAAEKKKINMREKFGSMPAEQQKAIAKALSNQGMGSSTDKGKTKKKK